MIKTRRMAGLALLTLLVLGLAMPVAAQSTGPVHRGYDPAAATGGHFHEGDLGAKALVLEQNLKCNCSCGLDVHSCQFQIGRASCRERV